jgi:hypothetical protein
MFLRNCWHTYQTTWRHFVNLILSCLWTSNVGGHFLQSRQTRHCAAASAVSAHDTSKSVIRQFGSGPLEAWPHLSALQLLYQTAHMHLPQTAQPKFHEKSSFTEKFCYNSRDVRLRNKKRAIVFLQLWRKYSVFLAVQIWDSSVGIPILWAGQSGVQIPVRRDLPHPWGAPSILCNGYRVFPGGKTAEAWRWPPIPSSADVKERVQLDLYSLSGPSWPVVGSTFT